MTAYTVGDVYIHQASRYPMMNDQVVILKYIYQDGTCRVYSLDKDYTFRCELKRLHRSEDVSHDFELSKQIYNSKRRKTA